MVLFSSLFSVALVNSFLAPFGRNSLSTACDARVWHGVCGSCSVRSLPGSDVRRLFPVPGPRSSAAVLHAQPDTVVPPDAHHHRESYGTRTSVGESCFVANVLTRPQSWAEPEITPLLCKVGVLSHDFLTRAVEALFPGGKPQPCPQIVPPLVRQLASHMYLYRWRPRWMIWQAPSSSTATMTTRT